MASNIDLALFLDTNIFIDHFYDRNEHSSNLIKLCEKNVFEAYASTSSFYTLAYFLQKSGNRNYRKMMENYSMLVTLISTTSENLYAAYASRFTDLEDAFQYFTARNQPNLNYFVTNNIKDFKTVNRELPVVTPETLLKKLDHEV
jgi:predicted nucleic acid-binding protein